MSIFDKEEVVAPTQEAAVAAAVKPSASKVECTRDTRGDAPCAVKDCENCN
jgi:hypothetical protein